VKDRANESAKQLRDSALSDGSKRNTRVNSRILYRERRIATRIHAASRPAFSIPAAACGKTLPSVVGAPAPCLRAGVARHAHPSLIVRVARKFERIRRFPARSALRSRRDRLGKDERPKRERERDEDRRACQTTPRRSHIRASSAGKIRSHARERGKIFERIVLARSRQLKTRKRLLSSSDDFPVRMRVARGPMFLRNFDAAARCALNKKRFSRELLSLCGALVERPITRITDHRR